MKRDNILHETANMCLVGTKAGLEVHLYSSNFVQSVVVGSPQSEPDARRFMERAERSIGNLRRMYGLL